MQAYTLCYINLPSHQQCKAQIREAVSRATTASKNSLQDQVSANLSHHVVHLSRCQSKENQLLRIESFMNNSRREEFARPSAIQSSLSIPCQCRHQSTSNSS